MKQTMYALPEGWTVKVQCRQSARATRYAYVILEPERAPFVSRYQYSSEETAARAGEEDAHALVVAYKTEV